MNIEKSKQMQMTKQKVPGFGLVIIGNEVLDGRRTDAHFAFTRDLLAEHRLALIWSMTIGDEPALIEQQLRWALQRPEPFFCCGGIGATPDDLTRDCAARALNRALRHHPEGVAILRERFGGDATEQRLRMVLFPEGAVLIPNPVNQVPGFRIANGYFLPGFPSMAHPMMRWVLDTYYETGVVLHAAALLLPNTREADLVYLMERFILRHPALVVSSLPAFRADGPAVELGLKGPPDAVAEGLDALQAQLQEAGIAWLEDASRDS